MAEVPSLSLSPSYLLPAQNIVSPVLPSWAFADSPDSNTMRLCLIALTVVPLALGSRISQIYSMNYIVYVPSLVSYVP